MDLVIHYSKSKSLECVSITVTIQRLTQDIFMTIPEALPNGIGSCNNGGSGEIYIFSIMGWAD